MILVTGAAGFIGAAVAERLLGRGERFEFVRMDLADREGLRQLFAQRRFARVVHLAAQAGVRHSLTHPQAYIDSNMTGFLNVLECLREHPATHCVYASSSSVYGGNTKMPFAETDRVDSPVSLYAVTKRANELMAGVYAKQFAIPLTGLRFFTVYGPWGRPDMAPIKFTRAILAGEPIDVYNEGKMLRDFTYIDDVALGVLAVLDLPVQPGEGGAPHRVFNIGNNKPEPLMHFIDVLEQALGRKAVRRLLPMQPGDVAATAADIEQLRHATGWSPSTSIDAGLPRMVRWYRDHFAP